MGEMKHKSFRENELRLCGVQPPPRRPLSDYKIGSICFLNSGSPTLKILGISGNLLLFDVHNEGIDFRCYTLIDDVMFGTHLSTDTILCYN